MAAQFVGPGGLNSPASPASSGRIKPYHPRDASVKDEVFINWRTVKQDFKGYDRRLVKLLRMLTFMRAGGSDAEVEFIRRFIDSLAATHKEFEEDGYGNRIIRVRNEEGVLPPILFSAHTDTVHHVGGMHTIVYDKLSGMVYKPEGDRGCLGADDGTGCFILLEMIKAKVPGTYVFHRDEESGGRGSMWIASNAKWLEDIKQAVAFDRRGTTDVIESQSWGDCCSQGYGDALADQLMLSIDGGYNFSRADGIFTDTANYMEIIPECTNISVGYEHEHGSSEYQDTKYALALAIAATKVDWSSLPILRDPTAAHYSYGGYGGYANDYGWENANGNSWWEDRDPVGRGHGPETGSGGIITHEMALALCVDDPATAAMVMVENNVTLSEVRDALAQSGWHGASLSDAAMMCGVQDESKELKLKGPAINDKILSGATVDYWMSKGYTEEQVREAAKEAGYEHMEIPGEDDDVFDRVG